MLEPFLRHRKVAGIDMVILTHGDYDHVGGLFHIVQNFRVRQVYLPNFESPESLTFIRKLEETGTPYGFITQEAVLEHPSGFKAQFFNPPADIYNGYLRKKPDVNDCSLVFRVDCNDKTILFTGDISKQVEKYLVEKYGDELRSDIVMAPHHGSKNSNTPDFVKTVDADCAVFSAGYNNYYNFPNPAVTALYAETGAQILRTDLMGALEFRFQENSFRLKTYRRISGANPPGAD